MERIKQAIEKARMQRGGHAMPAPGRRPAPQGIAAPETDLDDLSYVQTRIARLQAAHLESRRIVAHDKKAPASRAFDLLRTQVLQRMAENSWRTLAITSPTPGSGKTMVAINLAMSIAHQTQKSAMLVDFDLRKPGIGSTLGLPPHTSLNEVLDGSAALPDALVNPDMPRLVVLPTARPVPNPSETLASHKVAGLITELRERYASRIVIFDLPPLLNTDDAISVLPQIDCVLMVVGDGMSSRAEIAESLRHLSSTSLLGVMLNKSDQAPKEHY